MQPSRDIRQTSPGRDDGRIDAIATRLISAYLDSQYHYVQFLTEHLADCGKAFGGDLDMVLVTAVLGQRRLEVARENPRRENPELSRIAMSALRIADVSGIPRETVRRKLVSLHDKGWVEKHPRHGWYLVGPTGQSPARDALRDLETRSYRRLARLHLRLSEILDRMPGDPET